MEKKEIEINFYNSSGMTSASQFYNNTSDINTIRFDDSTSATKKNEEFNIL